jgi:phosphoglycerate kinase
MGTITDGLGTMDEMDVEGMRVLLRADFDVPLVPSASGARARVADDARIRSALPTIQELRRRGARLVLISHLDHPRDRDPALSMQPVADRLGTLLGTPVPLAPKVVGPHVRELTERLEPGAMLMLENARFEAGEMRNDPGLASALADLAELYVDDSFRTAPLAHASTHGVAHRLPSAAGRLMQREILALSAIVERPARPLVAIVGGTNIREKLGVIVRLLEIADSVCIGGTLCFPFLAALGHSLGDSLCRPQDLAQARRALDCAVPPSRVQLPSDLQLAKGGEEERTTRPALNGVDVPAHWTALDIGPRTADRYAAETRRAATVFWDGPMGRYELFPFAGGTRAIATAVSATSAATVVGGGETIEALRSYGLTDRVSHLSTGGRATLEFLGGKRLPGVQVLVRDRATAP